jgi:hypothetical protein
MRVPSPKKSSGWTYLCSGASNFHSVDYFEVAAAFDIRFAFNKWMLDSRHRRAAVQSLTPVLWYCLVEKHGGRHERARSAKDRQIVG